MHIKSFKKLSNLASYLSNFIFFKEIQNYIDAYKIIEKKLSYLASYLSNFIFLRQFRIIDAYKIIEKNFQIWHHICQILFFKKIQKYKCI
jgi:hypothetical protein